MSKCLICGKDENNFLFCSREHRIEYDNKYSRDTMMGVIGIGLAVIVLVTGINKLLEYLSLW